MFETDMGSTAGAVEPVKSRNLINSELNDLAEYFSASFRILNLGRGLAH